MCTVCVCWAARGVRGVVLGWLSPFTEGMGKQYVHLDRKVSRREEQLEYTRYVLTSYVVVYRRAGKVFLTGRDGNFGRETFFQREMIILLTEDFFISENYPVDGEGR